MQNFNTVSPKLLLLGQNNIGACVNITLEVQNLILLQELNLT